MMIRRGKMVAAAALILCAMFSSAVNVLANEGAPQRDALRSLRRALTEANATALTTDQETQINALITAYQNALPDNDDDALEAARDAFDAAVLAGNLAAAQAQATIIANRTAALASARLQAEAQFEVGVLATLRNGGQLTALVTEFGNDRVLGVIDSLLGRGLAGGGGLGGGRIGRH
jgi:Spy/CpxP family protein refolding chaperone